MWRPRGIATKIGNHTFRAIGITRYLKNGDTLEMLCSLTPPGHFGHRISVGFA